MGGDFSRHAKGHRQCCCGFDYPPYVPVHVVSSPAAAQYTSKESVSTVKRLRSSARTVVHDAHWRAPVEVRIKAGGMSIGKVAILWSLVKF